MLDDLLKQICVDEANIEYFIEVDDEAGGQFLGRHFRPKYFCVCIWVFVFVFVFVLRVNCLKAYCLRWSKYRQRCFRSLTRCFSSVKDNKRW